MHSTAALRPLPGDVRDGKGRRTEHTEREQSGGRTESAHSEIESLLILQMRNLQLKNAG